MSSRVPVFVDLQGFVVREKFVIKEIAVLRDGDVLTHRVFSEPMTWDLLTKSEKSKACWLTANHHGLQWKDGDVEYALAKGIVRRAVCDGWNIDETTPLIYVKGLEKRRWLEEILGDAAHDVRASIKTIDADYEDIGRLEDMTAVRSFRCERHVKNCAMANVCKLRDWWMERNNQLNSRV